MLKISKIALGVLLTFLVSCDNSQNNNLINIKKTDDLNEFLIEDTVNNFYTKYKCDDSFKSEYIFNPKKEYVVITDNVTKITFSMNSFNYKDSVKLLIANYEDISSIIFQELTTTSENKILETGGMFNIKAENYRTGEDLILEKPYTIECDSKKNSDSMSLFLGKEIGNGIINWTMIDGSKLQKKERENGNKKYLSRNYFG
jgi:hypothetical protein